MPKKIKFQLPKREEVMAELAEFRNELARLDAERQQVSAEMNRLLKLSEVVE